MSVRSAVGNGYGRVKGQVSVNKEKLIVSLEAYDMTTQLLLFFSSFFVPSHMLLIYHITFPLKFFLV